MLKLGEIKLNKGAKHAVKRVARGTSSGHGKTAGRGHKGQSSRSGGTKGIRFEGGQTPLYRRLPKRGFKNFPFKKTYPVINVEDLNRFDGEAVLAGYKVLGEGKLTKALKVTAAKFSAQAKKKIEAAGGQCST
jgi:large subunit ribosomal protein L15